MEGEGEGEGRSGVVHTGWIGKSSVEQKSSWW